MNTQYTITEPFPRDIDNVPCQPVSKYLLAAMREVNNNNNYFTRDDLITWMRENRYNPLYRNYSKGIRSENNLKNHWTNAHKNRSDENHIPHNSRILNIQTFYEPI